MTAIDGDTGGRHNPERAIRVHIDRLVLHNVDLGTHGARSLERQIATELDRGAPASTTSDAVQQTTNSVAAGIARRVRAAITHHR